MSAMRHAVAISRMREGTRILQRAGADDGAGEGHGEEDGDGRARVLSIDWKEALFLATKGGADALNLPRGSGTFAIGAPFDAQCSKSWSSRMRRCKLILAVRLFDAAGEGVGSIDFFEDPRPGGLTTEMIEKWWCIGDARNRRGMWVQGRSVESASWS